MNENNFFKPETKNSCIRVLADLCVKFKKFDHAINLFEKLLNSEIEEENRGKILNSLGKIFVVRKIF